MSQLTATITFSVAEEGRCVKVACGDYFEMMDKPMVLRDPGMFSLIVENFCLAGVIEDGVDIEFVFEDEEDLRTVARNDLALKDNVISCTCHGHKVTVK